LGFFANLFTLLKHAGEGVHSTVIHSIHE